MIHTVGRTGNGWVVYVDLINSAAAAKICRQPHLLALAAEALPKIQLQKPKHVIEYNMKRTIGYDFVIEADAAETVFYAKLVKDDVYTRFVKHAKPLHSSHLTMHLQRSDDENAYLLQDAWIGHSVPPRPGSVDETEISKPYWAKHALIFDNQTVQSQTLTKKCPY
ncbi:MAG: hypothetical protein ACREGD_00645 [Candidatus Saccharimonadales bacterium]